MPRFEVTKKSANLTASGVPAISVLIFSAASSILSEDRKAILKALFSCKMVSVENPFLRKPKSFKP